MTFRTGDLGAKAVWQGRLQAAQNGGPGGFAGPGAAGPGKYSPPGGGTEP
jgi:hypothetical protein